MKKTNIYKYFVFGYNYRILRLGKAGDKARGEQNALEDGIREFLDYLRELDLKVTEGAAFELTKILEEIKQLSEHAVVSQQLADKVITGCDKLDATLDSELQLRSAYILNPKRFDVDQLTNKAWTLLSQQSSELLPTICRFDFIRGCQCIAFAQPTAAAFHLMRCLEGMLRHYYCALIKKRDRIDPLLWGPIVTQLRKRKKPPPKPLLDHLDNIRENFRNPTQHPDARYDLDEAQDLLAVAIDALNRITKVFPAAPPKKGSQ